MPGSSRQSGREAGSALLSLQQEDQENVNPEKGAPAPHPRAQAALKAGNARGNAPQQRLKTRRVKGREGRWEGRAREGLGLAERARKHAALSRGNRAAGCVVPGFLAPQALPTLVCRPSAVEAASFQKCPGSYRAISPNLPAPRACRLRSAVCLSLHF